MLGKKGFTMVELLIVLTIIIAIAATGAIYMRGNAKRLKASEAIQVLGVLRRDVVLAAKSRSRGYDEILKKGLVTGGAIEGYDGDFLEVENSVYYPDDYMVLDVGSSNFTLGAKGDDSKPYVTIDNLGSVDTDAKDSFPQS